MQVKYKRQDRFYGAGLKVFVHKWVFWYHRRADDSNRVAFGVVGSLLTLTILSFIILSSSATYGDGSASTVASSNASVTVSATCSMTANVDTPHSATIANGTYRADIGQTTIQTFCNDPNGYALYAIGYGDDTEGNTVLHSSSLSSSYDITTGTAQSGDVSNWAMKVNAVSGTYTPSIVNYNNYHSVPVSYDKVAYFGSSTDHEGGVGSSVTTTYAAYISGTQPAGTYEGQVKYVLVHPSSHLDPTTRYMQEVDTWGNSINVGEQVVAYDTRDNKAYTVARLCTDGTPQNCTASQLWMVQGLDLDLSNGTALNSINTDLTAYNSSWSGYTMDSNGTVYWNPATTASTINFEGGTGTTVSGWTNDNDKPYSASPYYSSAGNDVYMLSSGSSSADTATNLAGCINSGKTETECAPYKVGNYYNFAAANATNSVAGTVGHTITDADDYTVMPNSICPAGWRLPHGLLSAPTSGVASANNSEFDTLLYTYGITPKTGAAKNENVGYTSTGLAAVRIAPLYFVRSGYVGGGTLDRRGTRGYSWSSTIGATSYGYDLIFDATTMYPAGNDNRFFGFPVRCIAREGKAIDEVTTMQEFATMSAERKSEVLASMVTDHQYQLIDERDGKVYWVSKLKDGKVWMTQALDLDLHNGTILEHTQSDIGWTEDNENKTWNPAASANTIQFEGGTGTTVSGWANDDDAPHSASPYYSSNGNDVYIMSSGSSSADTVTNLAGCTGTGKSAAECAHYKVGNYYNFAAANATNSVAGTVGHTITDADDYTVMPDSICPAGWRMPHGLLSAPTSGVASANNSEFDTLLYTYGITPKTGAAKGEDVGFTSTGSTAVRVSPLYFVRSGRVNSGTLNARGTLGYSWSSTISATSYGYDLVFSDISIIPAEGVNRFYGFPVRCILR